MLFWPCCLAALLKWLLKLHRTLLWMIVLHLKATWSCQILANIKSKIFCHQDVFGQQLLQLHSLQPCAIHKSLQYWSHYWRGESWNYKIYFDQESVVYIFSISLKRGVQVKLRIMKLFQYSAHYWRRKMDLSNVVLKRGAQIVKAPLK